MKLKERTPEARDAYLQGYRAGVEAAAKDVEATAADARTAGPSDGENMVRDLVVAILTGEAKRIRALAAPPPEKGPVLCRCGHIEWVHFQRRHGAALDGCGICACEGYEPGEVVP